MSGIDDLTFWRISEWAKILTPITIGLLALYIARQQWLTSTHKIKIDLFDRRFKVYDATVRFCVALQHASRYETDEFFKFESEFRQQINLAGMLFDQNVMRELNRLIDHYDEMVTVVKNLGDKNSISEDEKEKCAEIIRSKTRQLHKQHVTLVTLFGPYLHMGHLK